MRKLLLVLAAACMAALPMSASAATVLNINRPLDDTFVDPCSGQTLVFTGTIHVLAGTTADGAGGFHFHMDTNVHDVSTVSATGTEYQGVGGLAFETYVRPPYPFILTVTSTLAFVSQGSTPNLFVQEVGHFTVNANGTMTANFDKFSLTCRG